jgi:DNA-binding GntR family transcriptional regulator
MSGMAHLMTDESWPAHRLNPSIRLVDQAYEAIREGIFDGGLPPGARLSVPELARRLGISRSPVKEAITRLIDEGLASFVPHRGAVVAEVSGEDLQELYQLREVLEGLACRLAAETITGGEVARLAEILGADRAAVETGDVSRHIGLDLEFHDLIRRSTGNQRLIEVLNRLQGQIRIALRLTSAVPGMAHKAVAEHELILGAIRDHDPALAESRARQHIVRLREALRHRFPPGAQDQEQGRIRQP